MRLRNLYILLGTFVVHIGATCFEASPAFPVPAWTNGAETLGPAFNAIKYKLRDIISSEKYDAASYSIELTSNKELLWSHFHTARKRNETRPGVKHVDGDSLYRIASISKTFTVLGLLYQHEAGDMRLDKPISDYILELSGEIPWKDITLRTLASQLAGIPRDFAQGDMINEPDPTMFGLPPASKDGLPRCDEYNGYIPCDQTDLLDGLKTAKPLFAPNQESSYSNVAFELIGLALERVTGVDFKDYMSDAIFEPLEMSSTTLDTPPDTHAVLPLGKHYWDVDAGIQNPTGGIYSSSNDMSKFVRYVLTHYNAIATGVNWMMPASWATSLHGFYGMPFEIFRTDAILKDSKRPVTFVTKSGGLPGYLSRISLMPEYGLGLTVLVAGDTDGGGGDLLNALQETVTVGVVQAAEEAIWKETEKKYAGCYAAVDTKLNSSLCLESSPSTGLILTCFISNGTDVFNTVIPKTFLDDSRPWRIQLAPTLLFKNETTQQGEIWRMTASYERSAEVDRGVWDEFCVTDIDFRMYAGLPINEIVFWHDEGIVELPAWRVEMKATQKDEEAFKLKVQG